MIRKISVSSVRPAYPVPPGRARFDESPATTEPVVVLVVGFPDMKAELVGQAVLTIDEAIQFTAELAKATAQAAAKR